MKTVSIQNPAGELKEILAASHDDRVLLKREGKPVALVIDVREKDEEQIRLENDPEFWRMIQQTRQEPMIKWETVKKDLKLDQKARGKARKKTGRKNSRKGG